MSDLIFSVKGSNEHPTKFIAEARNFKLVVDEPNELGGTDHGANPVEYLLAGYAGCLNVVSHLVANELGFTIHKLDVVIEGNLDPAKLFGEETTGRAGFKSISAKLIPEAEADQETLNRWLEIVERRCPINDNLSNPTSIQVTVEKKELLEAV